MHRATSSGMLLHWRSRAHCLATLALVLPPQPDPSPLQLAGVVRQCQTYRLSQPRLVRWQLTTHLRQVITTVEAQLLRKVLRRQVHWLHQSLRRRTAAQHLPSLHRCLRRRRQQLLPHWQPLWPHLGFSFAQSSSLGIVSALMVHMHFPTRLRPRPRASNALLLASTGLVHAVRCASRSRLRPLALFGT